MKINRHDTIVGFVAGDAQRLGFKIKYLEGNYTDVTVNKPQIPEKLINHRPDVVAFNELGAICIGEAKTGGDLKTKRSRTQLIDFISIVRKHSDNKLIIGIPISEKHLLIKLLHELGIVINNQIKILEIPEMFLQND